MGSTALEPLGYIETLSTGKILPSERFNDVIENIPIVYSTVMIKQTNCVKNG
jgi:hypothetical protein